MMTLEELQTSTINAAVAREAYTQADRHLLDLLDVRKSFEQKAATLMGVYNTISLALFGIAAAISKDAGTATKVWPFLAAGSVFLLAFCALSWLSNLENTPPSVARQKCGSIRGR